MYAWAHHAPPLQLPKDVGFHVGGKSKIKYLVLQVHYATVDRYTGTTWRFLHFKKIHLPSIQFNWTWQTALRTIPEYFCSTRQSRECLTLTTETFNSIDYWLCLNSQPKTAGVLLMGTGGRIKANSVEHMDTACKLSENKVIHPFAFRTHTHALGRPFKQI